MTRTPFLSELPRDYRSPPPATHPEWQRKRVLRATNARNRCAVRAAQAAVGPPPS